MALKRLLSTFVVCSALITSAHNNLTYAQNSYPVKQITLVVGFGPGGFPDITTRIFANQLSKQLGTTVVVLNRPSAGTLVAADSVARAAPDGYTLLAADSTMWGITPIAFKKVPFNPMTDFEPVSIMAKAPVVLVTSGTLPFSNDFKEMISFFKKSPGKYSYGTAGVAGFHHLVIELLQSKVGIQLNHLPYKGSSQILPALGSGEVSLAFQSPTQIQNFLKEGKIKAFAVTGSDRVPILPNTPTLGELGVKGMELYGVMALLAPKGTPSQIIQRLAKEMSTAAKNDALKRRFEAQSTIAVGSSPDELLTMMKSDISSFSEAARIAKLQAK